MTIEPLQDFVLIQKKKNDVTASGLILPTDRDEEINLATVIEKGEKVTLPVEKGQTVLIQYGFDDLTLNGIEYSLGKQEHIRAIVYD